MVATRHFFSTMHPLRDLCPLRMLLKNFDVGIIELGPGSFKYQYNAQCTSGGGAGQYSSFFVLAFFEDFESQTLPLLMRGPDEGNAVSSPAKKAKKAAAGKVRELSRAGSMSTRAACLKGCLPFCTRFGLG